MTLRDCCRISYANVHKQNHRHDSDMLKFQKINTLHLHFTFSHFADAFIQSNLQLGNTLILKRQTDRGSAPNTKSQALFK